MPFELSDMYSALLGNSQVMVIEPGLPAGVYAVTLTGVRAADSAGFAVICTVPAASGDGTAVPVLWSVPFDPPVDPPTVTKVLASIPLVTVVHKGIEYGPCHLLWVTGADGQITHINRTDWGPITSVA